MLSRLKFPTLILAIIMQSVMVLVFGDASKILLPIIPGVVTVAGAQLTYNILAATVMSWIIIAALYAFVRGTHTGRAMQAVSMDEKGAAISGVDP